MKKNVVKKSAAVSDSQKRAVAALRRAEHKRIDEAKYTLGVFIPHMKGSTYGMPFCCIDDNIAARSFRECVDSEAGASMRGSDLWRVADYNFSTGVIKLCNPRKFITY